MPDAKQDRQQPSQSRNDKKLLHPGVLLLLLPPLLHQAFDFGKLIRGETQQRMVKEFVDRVFNGSAKPLLVHLVADRGISFADLPNRSLAALPDYFQDFQFLIGGYCSDRFHGLLTNNLVSSQADGTRSFSVAEIYVVARACRGPQVKCSYSATSSALPITSGQRW